MGQTPTPCSGFTTPFLSLVGSGAVSRPQDHRGPTRKKFFVGSSAVSSAGEPGCPNPKNPLAQAATDKRLIGGLSMGKSLWFTGASTKAIVLLSYEGTLMAAT